MSTGCERNSAPVRALAWLCCRPRAAEPAEVASPSSACSWLWGRGCLSPWLLHCAGPAVVSCQTLLLLYALFLRDSKFSVCMRNLL